MPGTNSKSHENQKIVSIIIEAPILREFNDAIKILKYETKQERLREKMRKTLKKFYFGKIQVKMIKRIKQGFVEKVIMKIWIDANDLKDLDSVIDVTYGSRASWGRAMVEETISEAREYSSARGKYKKDIK
jgi:hypothetical protein